MTPAEALQQTLAAEHATVYVYGVLGGRFPASDRPQQAAALLAAYRVHVGRRDRLRELLARSGAVPTPAAAAYDVPALPHGQRDPAAILEAARATEVRCAAVYAQLVAASTGPGRRWAVQALTDSAVRQLVFGGRPSAYPGAGELG